jgi:hypothetical protein
MACRFHPSGGILSLLQFAASGCVPKVSTVRLTSANLTVCVVCCINMFDRMKGTIYYNVKPCSPAILDRITCYSPQESTFHSNLCKNYKSNTDGINTTYHNGVILIPSLLAYLLDIVWKNYTEYLVLIFRKASREESPSLLKDEERINAYFVCEGYWSDRHRTGGPVTHVGQRWCKHYAQKHGL